MFLYPYDPLVTYPYINKFMDTISHFLWNNATTNNAILSNLSNTCTIVGLGIAVIAYFSWKKEYKLKASHEYAVALLKKVKQLHLEIQIIRVPKFHHPQSIANDIEKIYIPYIREKVTPKVLEIHTELLIAEKILVKHTDIQKKFNETIVKKVIDEINMAISAFIYDARNSSHSEWYKTTQLWEILFPTKNLINHSDIKESSLGVKLEVIHDIFNQTVEECFSSMYKALEENII